MSKEGTIGDFIAIQRHEFNNLWSSSLSLHQKREGVFLPEVAGNFGLLSLVVRLADIKEQVNLCQNQISTIAPAQFSYPLSSVHITVMNFNSFCGDPTRVTDGDVEKINSICDNVSKDMKPFVMEAVGLGLSPTTVFIEFIQKSESLRKIRKELEKKLPKVTGKNNFSDSKINMNLAYANILRMRSYDNIGALIDYVSAHRTRYLGIMVTRRMELVLTDKVMSSERTKTCSTFSLE